MKIKMLSIYLCVLLITIVFLIQNAAAQDVVCVIKNDPEGSISYTQLFKSSQSPLSKIDLDISRYIWPFYASFAFADGNGTESNPYQISNVTHLQNMELYLDAHYILINDIDASETVDWNYGAGFDPVGDDPNAFTGCLDGQNYTITDLYINRPSTDYVGLFGGLDIGRVKNVGLENADVSGGDYVGGLVGVVGGGFGMLNVNNSYATGDVSGGEYVGGLVGFVTIGTVSNSYATGDVSGENDGVGGLVGANFHGTVSNSYATGDVSGDQFVAGLVGLNFYGTVSNSYATGDVSGNFSDFGGLVGFNYCGTVCNSYATGAVSGGDYVGGLVGYTTSSSLKNTYATGAVSGGDYVGGLMGAISGSSVSNSYATGDVSGDQFVGGLVGRNKASGVKNSFWNIDTSGQQTSAGGTGKNTSEMMDVRTFSDVNFSDGLNFPWDFVGDPYDDTGIEDTWDIINGVTYPFFSWQIYPPYPPTITGPTYGNSGTAYSYEFKTIDPNGDDVYYYIDWGDDTLEEWIGPHTSGEEITISHTWIERGTYEIKAKAKNIYGTESEWGYLEVTMPVNIGAITVPTGSPASTDASGQSSSSSSSSSPSDSGSQPTSR